jgi:uncharacterized membrane protein HdeD (DUF308 family)
VLLLVAVVVNLISAVLNATAHTWPLVATSSVVAVIFALLLIVDSHEKRRRSSKGLEQRP